MITDSLCPVAWTARPGSFVGLMTLYESNYVRLGWLVPDFASIVGSQVSRVKGDCPLTLRLEERSRYTTTLALTYLFDDPAGVIADPDIAMKYEQLKVITQDPLWTRRRWEAIVAMNR